MTPQEKMQKIVEAAGECWHRATHNSLGSDCRCGNIFSRCPKNPSPTDLNELFRLAEKLKLYSAEALLDALYQSVKEVEK